MDIVQLLTSPGPYVLSIAIFILTFFVRRIVETVWPSLKKQADANSPKTSYLSSIARWWNEVILYAVPVVFGCLIGAFVQSEFAFPQLTDAGSRIMLGGGLGWFSSFFYKSLKKAMGKKLGVSVDSTPPSPPAKVGL